MKYNFLVVFALLVSTTAFSQVIPDKIKNNIKLEEYNLENGLHVILCHDTTSTTVNVGVSYHVGSKNERSDRTGFAHLFEHLLFHGSKNIPEGMYERHIASVGGYSNAATSVDRTMYYQILPANQYKLGLWLESERMMHPNISEKGLAKEIQVVKEENRQRYDRTLLGRADHEMMAFIFDEHPYRWPIIGSMEHLDAASQEDFKQFFETYYAPNNACLFVAGNYNVDSLKTYINAYFAPIPKGKNTIIRPKYTQIQPKTETVEFREIKNLKKEHLFTSYMAVPETNRDSEVLSFLINLLDKNNFLKDEMVGKDKDGLVNKILLTPEFYEDCGMVWLRADLRDSVDYRVALDKIDAFWAKYAKEGFDENEITRLKNSYKNGMIEMYFSSSTFVNMASTFYTQRGSTDKIYTYLDDIFSITNDDIKRVIAKYLVKDNRKVLVFKGALDKSN